MLKDCTGAERLLGVEVRRNLGRPEFTIKFEVAGDAEPEERNVTLKPGVWNKAAIVSALVRAAYSQDEMEAINNNRLSVLADLMEGLRTEGLVGAIKVIVNQSAEAKAEYETMQKWRTTAKRWAAELLTQYPEIC